MLERMPVDDLDNVASTPHPLMSEGHITTVALEEFGHQLQAYRLGAKLTAQAFSETTDWSLAKIYRMEGGLIRPTVANVRAYLTVCGITDRTVIDAAGEIARANRKALVDKTYEDILSPKDQRYLEHEATADGLMQYEASTIPDVFQSEKYAASILRVRRHIKPQEGAHETALRSRLLRERAAYLLGQHGPALHIIMDELIFYRPAGSEDQPEKHRYDEVAASIRGLQRLHAAGGHRNDHDSQLNPNVTIQIAPALTGLLLRGGKPFSVLQTAGKPIVATSEWTAGITNWFGDSDMPAERQRDFIGLSEALPSAQHTNQILDGILAAVTNGERSPFVGLIAAQFL